MQAETASLLERTASQRATEWTISTPKLLTGGILAGTSGGCLATLSGIGGPPLILMYELLAVPKASDSLHLCRRHPLPSLWARSRGHQILHRKEREVKHASIDLVDVCPYLCSQAHTSSHMLVPEKLAL